MLVTPVHRSLQTHPTRHNRLCKILYAVRYNPYIYRSLRLHTHTVRYHCPRLLRRKPVRYNCAHTLFVTTCPRSLRRKPVRHNCTHTPFVTTAPARYDTHPFVTTVHIHRSFPLPPLVTTHTRSLPLYTYTVRHHCSRSLRRTPVRYNRTHTPFVTPAPARYDRHDCTPFVTSTGGRTAVSRTYDTDSPTSDSPPPHTVLTVSVTDEHCLQDVLH